MGKGFKRPEHTATIVIDEGDYAGAELVVVTNPPWKVFREITLYTESGDDAPTPPGPDATPEEREQYRAAMEERQREQFTQLDELITLVSDHVLRGWNLVDHKDRPYPADADGLAQQDPEFIAELIGYWVGVIGSPDPKAPTAATAGGKKAAKSRKR